MTLKGIKARAKQFGICQLHDFQLNRLECLGYVRIFKRSFSTKDALLDKSRRAETLTTKNDRGQSIQYLEAIIGIQGVSSSEWLPIIQSSSTIIVSGKIVSS